MQDLLNHDFFRIAVVVIAAILAIWVFQKVIRFVLILLIVGFLIWQFWLS